MENLAYSNFAFFTAFIMSSLTVLPYGLLGSYHGWFLLNGVNQEVTVKLTFVTAAARRPFTWQKKEVHIWRKSKKQLPRGFALCSCWGLLLSPTANPLAVLSAMKETSIQRK